MTFNFASFIGGAADQMDANRQSQQNQQRIDLERQRTEDSGKALADQLETSRMTKEAMQRKLADEKAAQEADAQFGKLMTQVGKPVESSPAPSAIPSDVSGMDKAPSPAEIERASSPQIKVGGISLMQQSDALREMSKWSAGHDNPAIQALAAKYAEKAEGVRGAEAFKIGAQTGDIAAAERHLRGSQNVAAVQLPNGGIQLDYGDGNKSRVYSDQMDYLNDLQARMSTEAMAAYSTRKNIDLQNNAKRIEAAQDRAATAQYRNARLAIDMEKIDRGPGGRGGSGGGGGSRSQGGGQSGGFGMKYTDFNATFGSQKDAAGNEIASAPYFDLASRIKGANPSLTDAGAAALASQVAGGRAKVTPTLNMATGQWEEAVIDPRSNTPILTGRIVDPSTPEFTQAPTDDKGNALTGEKLAQAQAQRRANAIVQAKSAEDQWLAAVQKSDPSEWSDVQNLMKSPQRVAELRSAVGNRVFQGPDAENAVRKLQMIGILQRQANTAAQTPAPVRAPAGVTSQPTPQAKQKQAEYFSRVEPKNGSQAESDARAKAARDAADKQSQEDDFARAQRLVKELSVPGAFVSQDERAQLAVALKKYPALSSPAVAKLSRK
ncbi:MAG: hypothetical protein IPO08_23425 [Xanthomonadales bacterium]|nr:hypothetical protein [Xanthomonadales bacterium]